MSESTVGAVVDLTINLGSLRIPDPVHWTSGRREHPESIADRHFRAAHIAYVLAHQEGLPSPEKTSNLLLVRSLSRVSTPSSSLESSGGSAAEWVQSLLGPLAGAGEHLMKLWTESTVEESKEKTVADDAYLLSEAFSLLEQLARGNSKVSARLTEIEGELQLMCSRELFAEACSISPFRYWLHFSAETRSNLRPVDYLFEVGKLRLESRSGWQYLGIRHESVAMHSYRAAQLGLVMGFLAEGAPHLLSVDDAHRIAAHVIMHDLPEARSSDPNRVAKAYVRCDEPGALSDQTMHLGRTGEAIREMWHAVEAKSTVHGKFAKDADRLEMLIEAGVLMTQAIPAAGSWIKNTLPLLETDIAGRIATNVADRVLDKFEGGER